MQIDVQLTENDYRRLGLLHQRKMRRISFVVYALLFFLVVLWTNDFQWDPLYAAVGLIGGLAIGLVYAGLNYVTIAIQTKRHFASDKLLQHKYTYLVSDGGIRAENDSGSYEIKWDEVFKVVSDKKIVALYVGSGRAIVIPKETVIRTTGQTGWETLVAILKRNLPSEKLKMKD